MDRRNKSGYKYTMNCLKQAGLAAALMLITCAYTVAQDQKTAPGSETPAEEEKKFYKKIGPEGQVIYTDKPDKDTTEITVPKGTTYQPVVRPSYTPRPPTTKEPEAFKYSKLEFSHPVHDQVNWDNNNTLAVTLIIEPELQAAHTLVLLLDGQQVAEGSQTSLTLTEVYPGTHELTAEIRDHQDNALSSHSVTFHQRRHVIKR